MDDHGSISQAPKPQGMPRFQEKHPQELISHTRPPKPKVGSLDTPCCRGLMYGIHPPPIEAESYEIKISLVRKIQESKFLGTMVENPYDHLNHFERLCDLIRVKGVPHDSIKLILFPFSLGGKASQWERMLPSHLVNSWDDCKEIFLNKFYPIERTAQTRTNILSFKQAVHEPFHEAWGRLKGYTRDCPHHGFNKGAILSIFYWGVDKEHKWTLNVASRGRFTNLTVDQGELLVENLAQSEENYGDEYARATMTKSASEEQSRTDEIKALNERVDKHSTLMDKLINASLQSAHFDRCFDVTTRFEGDNVDLGTQQDLDMKGMLQQLLTGQANRTNELNEMVAEIHNKVEALSSRIMYLDHQNAQGRSIPIKPMANLEAQINESRVEENSNDENEESLLEIEAYLHGSQYRDSMVANKTKVEEQVVLMTIDEHKKDNEVESPRIEHVGSFSIMDVVSPPKASFEKKGSCGERAFGYGNGEEALALDGSCLGSLFSTTMGREKESIKDEDTKTKKKKPHANHPPTLDPSSYTMTLIPWRYDDGAIEYKVQCKGRSTPFAKVKALLTAELKEKGPKSLQEVMSKVIQLELKAPPWRAHTPLSSA